MPTVGSAWLWKHHGRLQGDGVPHGGVAVAQRAGRIGDVAALVRVHGDAVGLAQHGVLPPHVVAHGEGRHAAARILGAGRAQHGAEIPAPGGVGVDGEVQPARAVALPQGEHALQRIDRALLRAADDRDGAEHGDPAAAQLHQRGVHVLEVHPGVAVHPLHQHGVLAQAQQRGGLGPRVVRRGWRQQHRRLAHVLHEGAVERDQPHVL